MTGMLGLLLNTSSRTTATQIAPQIGHSADNRTCIADTQKVTLAAQSPYIQMNTGLHAEQHVPDGFLPVSVPVVRSDSSTHSLWGLQLPRAAHLGLLWLLQQRARAPYSLRPLRCQAQASTLL